MSDLIENMCAAWRDASNGDYLAWSAFGEGEIKDRERQQMRAALSLLTKPENISDEMVRAVSSNFGGEGCEAVEMQQYEGSTVFEEYKQGIRTALCAAISAALQPKDTDT